MTPKPILILPFGTGEHVVTEAREAGYLPLIGDPDRVRILQGIGRVTGDDVMMAALEAIQGANSDSERSKFCQNLWRRIKEAEGLQ